MSLEPCPFCGNEDVGAEIERNNHFIECYNCLARGPRVTRWNNDYEKSNEDARDKWNKRTDT